MQTVMERNLELERQNQQQKEMIRQMQQRQQAPPPTAPSFAGASFSSSSPSERDLCQLAYNHFKQAPRPEQTAVKYTNWKDSRSGLIPEALGRLLFHHQWNYDHTFSIQNNDDIVRLYNSKPVPDSLVQDIGKDKKHSFVNKRTIETDLERALRDITQYSHGATTWIANSPQLSYNVRYNLAEFLNALNRISQKFATPVVDYQDLKTRLLNVISRIDENSLISTLRVIIRGGNFQSPEKRSLHLPSRLSLRKMEFKTSFMVQSFHNQLRDLMNQTRSFQPIDYLYTFVDALSSMN